MTRRAFRAIVFARVYAERRTLVYACVASIVAGFVQPHGIAGPIFFCSLLGIIAALAQGPGRHPHLDLCEASAPFFGRELARAKAVVPCLVAVLATTAYWGAQLLGGAAARPEALVVALVAVTASTLVALGATIRAGWPQTLYLLLAAATSATAYAIGAYANSPTGELAFCALTSFLALRQYGEALARFDPVGAA